MNDSSVLMGINLTFMVTINTENGLQNRKKSSLKSNIQKFNRQANIEHKQIPKIFFGIQDKY